MTVGPGQDRVDLYTLLGQPAPARQQMVRALVALAAGWRARDWIEAHAEEQGVVFAGVPTTAPCKPCARYTVAVLRGHPESEALKLACDQLREMRQRVLTAQDLVEKYAQQVTV